MDETKRVIVEQDDDVKVIVKPSAASKKLTVDDEHEMGLSWDEEGVHFRVDETDDLPVSKAVDSDTVDGKHASDLQNYNNLTNKPDLKKIATTGSYNDLEDKPEFLKVQVQADWNETNKRSKAYIKNKPTSFSSDGGDADTVDGKHASDLQDYNNLTNKPDIPVTAGNAENAVRLKNGKDDYQMGEGAVCLSPTAQARGDFSFAEGNNTYTLGDNAHAEGIGTIASDNAHAEGNMTLANSSAFLNMMKIKEINVTTNVLTLYVYDKSVEGTEERFAEFFETVQIGEQLLIFIYNSENYHEGIIAEITDVDRENKKITLDKTLTIDSSNNFVCAAKPDDSFKTIPAHAEGTYTVAAGVSAHTEGTYTVAAGDSAHAEGGMSIAAGDMSHAEGSSFAYGMTSHAEGQSGAHGDSAHAEGTYTVAAGDSAHAEGFCTIASSNSAHAEGSYTVASYTAVYISSINKPTKTITVSNKDGVYGGTELTRFFDNLQTGDKLAVLFPPKDYITIVTILSANKQEKTIVVEEELTDDFVHCYMYPYNTKSELSFQASHAEGVQTIAGNEGAHAEGEKTIAKGQAAHAEGYQTEAIGKYAHSEGKNTMALHENSHAEGDGTRAEGESCHAEGIDTIALAKCAHAEGCHSTAAGLYSHAQGLYTIANNYQHTGGKFNIDTTGGTGDTTEGSAFVIGNGTSEETRSNCFRVQFDGKVFSQGEYATTGADYAELFEWEDQNKQSQDRRGLFVALKGTKIHIADSTDKNIIGIISSKPAMVGNNYSETWKDMYLTDLWGDVITQRKTIPAKYETVKNVVFEKDENGEEKEVVKEEQILVSEAYEADIPVLNPDYNKDMVYIPRHERKEWGIVGMLGQLIVEDDGSCEADGYCKCADGGIATKADSGYYIMERIDASHIRVLFK